MSTSWQTSLPDCGFHVTSTLVSGSKVYAACNGYVYLLDIGTGNVLYQNGLSGRGNKEVRLAISDNGWILIVGIDGYVLGLNSSNLDTWWEKSLPKCGYNLVNVFAAGGGGVGYAACNGYVYSYNVSDGEIQKMNSLSGRGEHETRLSLTFAADVLLVGINGYALGLDSSSLSTDWQTSLPDCGYAITSVTGGEGCCYAACNGYLYKIDASTGEVTDQNGMDGTGKAECRLCLRQDGGALFVGLNGYAFAAKSSDISTIYRTSLPDCGFNITDVISGVFYTYFGCNGYVYSLDDYGHVVTVNALPGLGKHETRLAIDTKAQGDVFIGINGYCVAVESVPPTPAGPWMANSAANIGPRMLRQITIPGSHDSGSYAIIPLSPIGQDLPWYVPLIQALPLPSIVVNHIIALWSISQPDDFLTQLNSGVRYFDLCVQGAVGGGSMAFVHGLVSAPIYDLINQVSGFMTTPGNEKEIIILGFNHFYAMANGDHGALIYDLLQAFPLSLAVYNPIGSNHGGSDGFNTSVTLNDLWATDARIIVYYADDASVAANNFLWPNVGNMNVTPAITSPWPDKANLTGLKEALDQELPFTGNVPFVLQCQITPDSSTVVTGIAGGPLNSLGAIAHDYNPQIVRWLNSWGPNVGINIVVADWVNIYPYLMETILRLNGVSPAAAEPPSIFSKKKAIVTSTKLPNSTLDPEDLVKGIQDGTIKLADIINYTHARAFRVFGRKPSKENVKALMELQEFVEGSEVEQSKLSQKPAVVHDPMKLEKKMGEMKM